MLATAAKLQTRNCKHSTKFWGRRQNSNSAVVPKCIRNQRKALGCFLYAAVGDAIGFKAGEWEFEMSTGRILEQAQEMGGVPGILDGFLCAPWPVSDDTVMHLATGLAVVGARDRQIAERVTKIHEVAVRNELEAGAFRSELNVLRDVTVAAREPAPWCLERFGDLCDILYTDSMSEMDGRDAGIQFQRAIRLGLNSKLRPIPHSSKAGGNGAAVRSMCLGLTEDATVKEIVARAIVSAKCTHPNFTAILGACMSAVFTNYAFKNIAPSEWPQRFFEEAYPEAIRSLKLLGPQWANAKKMDSDYFFCQWQKYIDRRFYHGNASFPGDWARNFVMRDKFFAQFAYSGWNGASAHDALIIAYDAFLFSTFDLNQLYTLSALHGGDSDSTGSLAGAFYGSYHGTTKRLNLNGTLEFLPFLHDVAYHLTL